MSQPPSEIYNLVQISGDAYSSASFESLASLDAADIGPVSRACLALSFRSVQCGCHVRVQSIVIAVLVSGLVLVLDAANGITASQLSRLPNLFLPTRDPRLTALTRDLLRGIIPSIFNPPRIESSVPRDVHKLHQPFHGQLRCLHDATPKLVIRVVDCRDLAPSMSHTLVSGPPDAEWRHRVADRIAGAIPTDDRTRARGLIHTLESTEP